MLQSQSTHTFFKEIENFLKIDKIEINSRQRIPKALKELIDFDKNFD